MRFESTTTLPDEAGAETAVTREFLPVEDGPRRRSWLAAGDPDDLLHLLDAIGAPRLQDGTGVPPARAQNGE